MDYRGARPGYVLEGPARHVAEVVQLWLLPVVGWPVCYALYSSFGYPAWAVATVLLLPVAVMMGVVYWGTQLRELWAFPVPYAPRGYLPQIGFIYAATLHLTFLLVHPLLDVGSAWTGGLLYWAVCSALGGVVGCLWDVSAIRHDLLRVFVGKFRRGRPPVEVVMTYGPRFFTTVAAGFSGATALVLQLSR